MHMKWNSVFFCRSEKVRNEEIFRWFTVCTANSFGLDHRHICGGEPVTPPARVWEIEEWRNMGASIPCRQTDSSIPTACALKPSILLYLSIDVLSCSLGILCDCPSVFWSFIPHEVNFTITATRKSTNRIALLSPLFCRKRIHIFELNYLFILSNKKNKGWESPLGLGTETKIS